MSQEESEGFSLSLNQLRVGMAFSHALVDADSGEIVLPARQELGREDIRKLMEKNYFDFITVGTMISEGRDTRSEKKDRAVVSHKLAQLREDLASQKQPERVKVAAGVAEDDAGSVFPPFDQPVKTADQTVFLQRMDVIEAKIRSLELLEETLDAYSQLLSVFLATPNKHRQVLEKCIKLVGLLISELDRQNTALPRIIAELEFGSHFVSHGVKVAILAIMIAKKLDMSRRALEEVALAALLHDIGKLSYTLINRLENVSLPPDKLQLPLAHPVYGYKTARSIFGLSERVCQMILNHHEQADGKGFPRRIDGRKLSQDDQILITCNLIENLFEKFEYSGYGKVFAQIDLLANKYPGKFDINLLETVLSMRHELVAEVPSDN